MASSGKAALALAFLLAAAGTAAAKPEGSATAAVTLFTGSSGACEAGLADQHAALPADRGRMARALRTLRRQASTLAIASGPAVTYGCFAQVVDLARQSGFKTTALIAAPATPAGK